MVACVACDISCHVNSNLLSLCHLISSQTPDSSLQACQHSHCSSLPPLVYPQVIVLHVRPTSVLYGADWGASDIVLSTADRDAAQKVEDGFDTLTAAKSEELAAPLKSSGIEYRIVIIKDHDMKERLCLEVNKGVE